MNFPHELFLKAGLNSTDVANVFDVSRITGYRWLRGVSRSGSPGVGVNIFLRDRVARVAAQVESAIEAGDLPDAELKQRPPHERAERIKSILAKHPANR